MTPPRPGPRPLARATATLAACLLVVPVGFAPAAAAPGPSGAPGLPAVPTGDLGTALAAADGLSEAEFDLQAEVAVRLAADGVAWAARFPEAFGGVRVDRTRGLVGIVPGAPGADDLARAVREAGFGVHDAPASRARLRDRLLEVDRWAESLPPDERAAVEVTGIDPDSGEVRVAVTTDDPASTPTDPPPGVALARTPFRPAQGSLSGSAASVDTAPDPAPGPAPAPLPGPVPGPVRTSLALGGMAMIVAHPTTVVANDCSLGFHGTRGGRVVHLTAAHCSQFGDDWAFAPGVLALHTVDERGGMPERIAVGRFTRQDSDDPLDAAVVTIDTEAARHFDHNRILVGVEPGGTPVTRAITGTARPVHGQTVCKFGARTGASCGVVNDDPQIMSEIPRHADKLGLDLCGLPGDSGGVVFTGSRAVGITSMSNAFDYATCTIAEREMPARFGHGPQVIAVAIDAALAQFPGTTLRTN